MNFSSEKQTKLVCIKCIMHADIYACDGWNLKINWVGSFDLRVNKSLCMV